MLLIDLPLFFGTTLVDRVVLSHLAARDRALRNPASPRRLVAIKRLPLMMSLGIGLCVNQTRAVLEALFGRETRVRAHAQARHPRPLRGLVQQEVPRGQVAHPVHRGGLAAYFAVAMVVALDHGHYLSMPFLALFLCGFGYVGWVSLWQGGVGVAIRAFATRFIPRAAAHSDRAAAAPFPHARLEADRPEFDTVGSDVERHRQRRRHIARA